MERSLRRDDPEGSMPLEIYALAAIGFVSALGFGMIGPSLPVLATLFAVGTATVSLAISGFAFVRLASNLALARLIGRWPLRAVLTTGLVVQSVCSIAAGLAPNFILFLLLRAISGTGSAAFTLSATALVLVLAPERVRGRAMSTYFTAVSVGTISGPAVGGAIAAIDARLPLVVYGTLLGVAAVIATVALRRVRDLHTADSAVEAAGSEYSAPVRHSLRRLISDRRFVAALACNFAVGWVFYGMLNSTVPLYFGALGFAVAAIGVLITCAAAAQIVASGLSGWLTKRLGARVPLAVGLAAGIAAVAVLGAGRSPVLLVICLVTIGLAGGLMATVPPALLAAVPGGTGGTGVAAFWVAFDSAAIVGPTLTGLLAESLGFVAAFLLGAAVLAVALVFVLRAPAYRTGAPPI